MEKVTQKQIFIGGVLVNIYLESEKGAVCYQVIDSVNTLKDQDNAEAKAIDTTKINSVNATLASLASKGLVEKSKVAYKDKMVTLYTPNQKLIDLVKESNK